MAPQSDDDIIDIINVGKIQILSKKIPVFLGIIPRISLD